MVQPTKPSSQRSAEGNRSKKPFNENRPTPDRGIPAMPKGLSPAAKTHWRRIAPILDKARILTLADGETLGALCESLARYYKAERKLQKEGEIVDGGDTREGRSYKNPWLMVSQDALKTVLSIGMEFGMTPSSRCRVDVPPVTDADDPISLYLDAARVGVDPAEYPTS